MSETTRILFDAPLMRPACVLLQAAYGCPLLIAERFPAESWLVAPTDDMKVYAVTEGQLQFLVDQVAAKYTPKGAN